MSKTIKLYDSHPYETEFEATILSAEPVKKGWRIVLDQTLFFPEEGGQSADTGHLEPVAGPKEELAVWNVTDVQIQNDVIYHTVSVPKEMRLEAGMKVSGKINWERRFSNM